MTVSNNGCHVCAGIYHGIIKDVNERIRRTVNGDVNTFEFIVEVETNNGWVTFKSTTFESDYENSRYQKLINEICNRYQVEQFYFDEHIGTDLTIKISLNYCNGVDYPNIDWYEPYYSEERYNG
ncbi:MAG: hypothetical protein IJS03_00105 [Eubacterium sp.]|nr:hypothetical protein [Eubacterium sp.]